MLERVFKRTGDDKENGFTLIEIVTVVAIIGVLSAAAVPTYNGVRRHATEASLKSDVRNAAMEMEKQAIFSTTGYADQLPETFYESTGNIVVIDADSSSNTAFCIIGTHPAYEDMFSYYHSEKRVVGEDQAICGFLDPEEYGPLPIGPEDLHDDEENTTPEVTPEPTPEPTTEPTPEPTEQPAPTENPQPTTTPSESPGDSGTGNNGDTNIEPTPTPTPSSTTTPTPPPTYTPPPPKGYDDPKRKKYTICHKGGAQLNLPLPAILNGHSKAHKEDIIPPVPGVFTGQNWTITGSTIWYDNCRGM